MRKLSSFIALLLCSVSMFPLCAAEVLTWEKQGLTSYFHSEGACYADIDGDGDQDVVSGPYWYEGPEFKVRNAFRDAKPFPIKQYSDAFFTFAHDFNGDGLPDLMRIPMPGTPAYWHENPGRKGVNWKEHLVISDVSNESPQLVDVTGDGKPELLCCYKGKIGYAEADWSNPTAEWKFFAISDRTGYGRFTHGLGAGDVNGDGRVDILETSGWWEQPEKKGEPFILHETRFAQSGGSQMYVYDFDADGDNDVLSVQNAHNWGLNWFEQKREGDTIQFVSHPILTSKTSDNPYGVAISQMHAMELVDMDGDGVKDIVTGKRYFAHGGNDPGAHELPVLYWLKTIRSKEGVTFEPWLIDKRCGVGTQVTVGDVTGDGTPDVIVGNKLGSFVIRSKSRSVTPAEYAELRPKKSSAAKHVAGTELFASHIRATGPLTPEEALASFVLPAGFEIELVASEPQIGKPMNIAFDTRGRLWVSSTVEYPYPARPGQKSRDAIKVLEDTDGDGKLDKTTTFADNVNIPIGIYPYGDGAIVFSIPNMWYLRDTDQDGVCDVREKLYGAFSYDRDTHGLCNAFTRGADGWLYACHGFNNRSTVAGGDGEAVQLISGTVFRVRLDGSRIEAFTRGQVNPFGLTFSPFGDVLTADCHTKPVSMMVRGGHHGGFGAGHDGLGHIPSVMEHLHGSTAIAGIVIGNETSFPKEYRESVFGGNVTTCRINRNSFVYNGSSPRMQEESDFLVSDDPWFRPVDLQVGPDGALYVADFYNRIIGHYEVALDHKGRDRTSGRIWRISHKDSNVDLVDLAKKDVKGLVKELESPVEARAALAREELVARMEKDSRRAQIGTVRALLKSSDETVRVRGMWVLHRLAELRSSEVQAALRDESPLVRNHLFRILADSSAASPATNNAIRDGLSDPDPMVRRAASLAAADHPSARLIRPLFKVIAESPSSDGQLRYAARMALRNHLRNPGWFANLEDRPIADAELVVLADLSVSLKTEHAANFIIRNGGRLLDQPQLAEWLKFAVQYADKKHLDLVASRIPTWFKDRIPFQLTLLNSVKDGLGQRGEGFPDGIRSWAEGVARQLLAADKDDSRVAWSHVAAPGVKDEGNSWVLSTKRSSADGQSGSRLLSSFVKGEQRTGIYRSDIFKPGSEFSFYIAGHDGYPDVPLQGKNFVVMRDARSRGVLHRAAAPRNDTAQRITWEMGDRAESDVYLELVDTDTAGAFAWLAVGRFSVKGLNPSQGPEHRQVACQLISDYQLHSLRPSLSALLAKGPLHGAGAIAVARSLAATSPDPRQSILPGLLEIHGADDLFRTKVADHLRTSEGSPFGLVEEAMKLASAEEQSRVAGKLVNLNGGLENLLRFVEAGIAAPALLNEQRIAQVVSGTGSPEQKARKAKLTENLFDDGGELAKLIVSRRESIRQKAGNLSQGKALFEKHCMVCHQVAGQGKNLAPNLDGIGNRGMDRVVEDILDPNRNVDTAFRLTTLVLNDDSLVSGFLQREEGAQLIMADLDGSENRVAKDQVKDRIPSPLSLMPPTFGLLLSEDEFRDLVTWLMSLR